MPVKTLSPALLTALGLKAGETTGLRFALKTDLRANAPGASCPPRPEKFPFFEWNFRSETPSM
jgi:hypothetical protein